MAKKKKVTFDLTSPVLYIVLGLLLALFPGNALNWAMTLAGIFFIVSGVVDLIKFNVFGGIVNVCIGVIILVLGWTLVGIVLLVLGIMIAVKGFIALISDLKRKKKSIFRIIVDIVTILVGFALAFGNALHNMLVIVGIVLVIDGVLGLIGAKK